MATIIIIIIIVITETHADMAMEVITTDPVVTIIKVKGPSTS